MGKVIGLSGMARVFGCGKGLLLMSPPPSYTMIPTLDVQTPTEREEEAGYPHSGVSMVSAET